jgi:hypothetical protein
MNAAVANTQVFKERLPEPHFGEGLSAGSLPLLQARIKDLRLHLSGTALERLISQLYSELDQRGVSMRPECYLSDQWGCPSGVPVIGIPFYLADPHLHSIEEALGAGAETERDIMMYLRHEAGHCFNYAWKLYDTDDWKKLFGDYTKPYHDDYKPRPFSKKYVVHLSGWYAQKHPDEDFAETFAVWLTPGLDWEKRYRGWGALKKLQYVQSVVAKNGRDAPPVDVLEHDLDVDEMEETVLDHYRGRNLAEKIDLQLGEHLDLDMAQLFESPDASPTRADTLLRAEKQSLIASVTHYSGLSRAVVRSVVEHLQERTSALNLTVHREKSHEYLSRVTALVATLAMNFLYTNRFFELDEGD